MNIMFPILLLLRYNIKVADKKRDLSYLIHSNVGGLLTIVIDNHFRFNIYNKIIHDFKNRRISLKLM